jgi:hypothetical protein
MVLALALLLTASAAQANEGNAWTASDTILEVTFVAVLAVDMSQTLWFTRHTRLEESNPIMGTHPSTARILTYNAACAATHATIAYLLPKPYRTIWQATWIAVEAQSVGWNWGVVGGFHMALP